MAHGHPFISRKQMRHNDGEDRCCGVQDRSLTRTDLCLSPDDKAERDGIVKQSHDEKTDPDASVAWHDLAGETHKSP